MPGTALLRTLGCAPWPLLFSVAGVGFMLSLLLARRAVLPSICVSLDALVGLSAVAALEAVLALNPLTQLLLAWTLMLSAMMPPLLAMPLMHVWRSSLPGRRVRAVGVFLVAYIAVWTAAAPVLLAAAWLAQLFAPQTALAAGIVLAIVWSASPWHRAALNRSHRLRRIGLFAWAADRDAAVFGATHGFWCIGSCWAWMLIPLLAGPWHMWAMLVVGVIVFTERLSLTESPRWRWPAFLPRADGRLLQLATRHTGFRHG